MSRTTRGRNPNHRLLIYDSLYHVEDPDAPRLVMLWKQYEFRPHFSAIRLMCNYFFKRGILLYLILVFIYYVSTEEIFVIYDGTASFCIVLDEIYFSGAASRTPGTRITFKLRWIVQLRQIDDKMRFTFLSRNIPPTIIVTDYLYVSNNCQLPKVQCSYVWLKHSEFE